MIKIAKENPPKLKKCYEKIGILPSLMSYLTDKIIAFCSVLNINNNINANNNNNNLANLNLGNNNNMVTNLNQNVGNNFNLMFPPGRRRKKRLTSL